MLAGPVLWSVHFLISYLLVEAFCKLGGADFNMLGVNGLSFILAVISVLAVAGTALAGVWVQRDRKRRRSDRAAEPDIGTVSHWAEDPVELMQLAGLLLSILFAATIIMVSVPVFVLQPCNSL